VLTPEPVGNCGSGGRRWEEVAGDDATRVYHCRSG
jgi:hypothetical protein